MDRRAFTVRQRTTFGEWFNARVRSLGVAAPLAVAIVGSLGAAQPVMAAPFAVQVSLQPTVIGMDETATLTIRATGGLGDFSFQPNYVLDNLEPAGIASRFENFSLVNGSFTHTFQFSIQLRPLAVGTARVRSLVVHVHGEQVRLPDQQVRVQEASAGQPGAAGPGGGAGGTMPEPEDLFDSPFGSEPSLARPQRAAGPIAFLRAEVQPPHPLVGEQAVYTVYLYSRQDVAAISPTSVPTFRGFWVRDLPLPSRLAPEIVNVGPDHYGRVPMIRKALFALRPGPHALEPTGFDVVVSPPGGGFFGPPLMRSEELHLATPEMALDVQPLPAAPAGFAGLVGQVSLVTTLKPYRLKVGEGATLAVTLTGAGNLQGAAAPPLEAPPALTVFPPQRQTDDPAGANAGGEGRRTWVYVVVPTHPGLYTVRPQPVLYFDPARHEYRHADAPALTLTVLPAPPASVAAASTAPPPPHRNTNRSESWWSALLHGLPSAPRTWPERLAWLGVLACLVALFALLVRRLARQLGSRQPVLPNAHRAATSSAAMRLQPGVAAGGASAQNLPSAPAALPAVETKLREAAGEERPRRAAALVEEGWRGYLAGRWGLPVTTPPARWGASLAAQGVGAEIAGEMTRLAEELHYLRHAPQLSTTDAVRDELLSRSRQLLRRLR